VVQTLRKYQIEDLLVTTAQQQASDLHLVVGRYPTLRIEGNLVPLIKREILTPKDTTELAQAMLTEEQWEKFETHLEIDFAYSFKNRARFRANVYRERGYVALALRFIPREVRTLEELNLPSVFGEFTQYSQGLVLVTGPTGHGKSTTLAALIDKINHERATHIITIEDPIEYLFEQDRAIISQREIGQDSLSFYAALKRVFRQDPDVIMVGEMRDPETIATAVTAAETGHLIFATLHTNSAAQTIDRIIDSFPADQQEQIKGQLANSLLGVISQRLLPQLEGGLVPAFELMKATHAVRNLIREGKTHEIDTVIMTSRAEGMISLNRSLADLVKQGRIAMETAQMYSLDRKSLKELIKT
jgi:twitching motility protein PilT